jgi:hypothetical protein
MPAMLEEVMSAQFTCTNCGEEHAGLATDHAYKLPDVVWAIPEPERSEQAKHTSDLCRLGQCYFIRGVLRVPFSEDVGDFAWGVWAEVAKPVFDRYLELYDQDGSAEPRRPGILANAIAVYEGSLGTPLSIQFQGPTERPSFHVAPGEKSRLALDQRNGITRACHHAILEKL